MTIAARITAGPEVSAAILVDFLAPPLGIRRRDPIVLGDPDESFDSMGFPIEGGRTVTVPLHIQGGGATVGVAMQSVARAISVPDRWLMIQRSQAADPVWFRIRPDSPGSLDIKNAFDRRDGWWSWTLNLTVDSTAVGEARSVPMVGAESPTSSITNTGVDRGVVIDTPGEAPAPLRVDVKPSVNINGRRPMISTFSVPWDSPLIAAGRPAIIREDSDFSARSGHSTRSTGLAFLSGGSGLTVTLSSTSNRQIGVTASGSTWRPEPGRYLILARLYREGGAGEVKIRVGQQFGPSAAMQEWRTWRPSAGGNRASWMPVGYLQHPVGDSGEGLRAEELMPPAIRLDVTPTVTSSGLLHLDQVAFVPVDLARGANESACFVDFADGIGFGGDFTLRVDGERRRTATVDYVGQHHGAPQPLRTGGWPVATPGMATCVSVFLDTTDAPVGIDSVSITSLLTVGASPRLLHLGQER